MRRIPQIAWLLATAWRWSSAGAVRAQNNFTFFPNYREPATAIKFSLSPPGARSLAMGGAFVALADDATAAYTHPADAGGGI